MIKTNNLETPIKITDLISRKNDHNGELYPICLAIYFD